MNTTTEMTTLDLYINAQYLLRPTMKGMTIADLEALRTTIAADLEPINARLVQLSSEKRELSMNGEPDDRDSTEYRMWRFRCSNLELHAKALSEVVSTMMLQYQVVRDEIDHMRYGPNRG